MKLEIISEEEFKEYADKSEQITFHQTVQWANLKKVTILVLGMVKRLWRLV